MSQEQEPSILEYARFYGLTIDYRDINPLGISIRDESSFVLDEDPMLFHITAGVAKPTPERLPISIEVAKILSCVRNDQCKPSIMDDIITQKTHRIHDMKMEIPLLRTDHVLDVRQFGGLIIPDLVNEHLPLENVNNELDEGLLWPSNYHESHLNAAKKSETEKLSISKDTLIYMKDVLSQHEAGRQLSTVNCESMIYKRNSARDPITPPLLPMPPEAVPYIPSSDTGYLELLSDQTDPSHDELHELDNTLILKDAITSNRVRAVSEASSPTVINSDIIGDIYSPLKGIEDAPLLPQYTRSQAEDFKVDGPLTPPRCEQPPPWQRKNVSFRDTLTEIIPELPSPVLPEKTSSEDIDRFFEEVVRPAAEEADRRLEQEQLQEADATQRVAVPVMDFSRPVAPWKGSSHPSKPCNGSKEVLQRIKEEHLRNSYWPMSGKVERTLVWAPFPATLAKTAVQEYIEGDVPCTEIIAQPDCIHYTNLIWKLDGIRIFDETESDTEEMTPADFSTPIGMHSLLRKRKLDLLENENVNGRHSPMGSETLNANPHSQADIEPTIQSFSALDALENFMSVRTGEPKRKKLTDSSYFPIDFKPGDQSLQPASQPIAITESSRPHQLPPQLPLPLPVLKIPTKSFPFMISSAFLTNRPLFRLIKNLFPTAEFIERDFSTSTLNPPPEADLLLSPTSALLTTTLQKLAQRPLPGSKSLSPLFTRLAHLAPRYEQLFILATDATPAGSEAAVYDSSCAGTVPIALEPLIPLHAFLAVLPVEHTPSVIVIPTVPSTRNPLLPLATHIVHLMTMHAVNPSLISLRPSPEPNYPPQILLKHEETNHELFLRRAGLNAFAAQVVLGALRPPPLMRNWKTLGREEEDGGKEGGERKWGLAAFVKMGQEARRKKLEGLIGRGLLERAGRLVDGQW